MNFYKKSSQLSYVDFIQRLNRDVWTLSEQGRSSFEKFKINPQRFKSKNISLSELDEIFVVAQSNQDIIVFDENVDQFGIGEFTKDNVVRTWCILGTLDYCLNQLEDRNF